MRSFGYLADGREIFAVTLKNKKGMEADITTYGATLAAVRLADKDGIVRDVVLGYDNAKDAQEDKGTFFGKIVGRNCNRIGGALVTIDGLDYKLEKNSSDKDNLHSGVNSSANQVFTIESESDSSVVLSVELPDMEQGFPGNMKLTVIYSLTEDNAVVIDYEAVSDKDTICNLTNHSYFNLNGHDAGNACDNLLQLNCSHMTAFGSGDSIPTGELRPISDTPMDFRTLHAIADKIGEDYDQLNYGAGYDHNYCIDAYDGSMQVAAIAKGLKSGICMEVSTDMPGIQLYTGNFIGERSGKGGVSYHDRSGYALETQFYPNATNIPEFPSTALSAGEVFRSTTAFRFYVEA